MVGPAPLEWGQSARDVAQAAGYHAATPHSQRAEEHWRASELTDDPEEFLRLREQGLEHWNFGTMAGHHAAERSLGLHRDTQRYHQALSGELAGTGSMWARNYIAEGVGTEIKHGTGTHSIDRYGLLTALRHQGLRQSLN